MLVALALCLKVLVPTGYMIDSGDRFLSVRICDGQVGGKALLIKVQTNKTGHSHGSGEGEHTDHAATHCPFATMAVSGLEADDPFFFAIALAFILALGFAPVVTPCVRRIVYARPPLRGPPAII
ncbi:hypothetical protein D6851_05030 [Altericroceibacterium spongiae]|uniref:DUF2946 domain-containing protein n=2 Tax=Altericroceibacterium spongiae TaxID=2320269 RepID=A0A420EPJ4_9SPHN|nr:hypothetical protein D6851_05030 [Altericroceibacterium spongiae]